MEESIQQVEKELEEYFVNLFQQFNNNDDKDDSDSTQTHQQQHTDKLNLDKVTEHIQHILTSQCKLTSNQLEYTLEKSRIMLVKNLEQALIQNKYRGMSSGGGNISPTKVGSMSPSKGPKNPKK